MRKLRVILKNPHVKYVYISFFISVGFFSIHNLIQNPLFFLKLTEIVRLLLYFVCTSLYISLTPLYPTVPYCTFLLSSTVPHCTPLYSPTDFLCTSLFAIVQGTDQHCTSLYKGRTIPVYASVPLI